jgi:transketolase
VRNTFVNTLCDLAEQDERVWLLCGDLGYSVLERFSSRFPRRYINVGVAEQNMVGVAAGLALSGKVVFTYSIANFPVMRCLEQLRNDVCYHNLSVKTVAVGAGLPYGTHGYTHHGVEDIAVMRTLPNMTVVAPGDPVETRLATAALLAHEGPGYLRLGKGGEPTIHQSAPDFQLGQALTLREGDDVAIISTGAILAEAVTAADLLATQGIHAGVLSMPTVQPLDTAAVLRAAEHSPLVVTVEEHRPVGGLGSAVAETLACAPGPHARLLTCGVTIPPSVVGSGAYLRERNGLDAAHLAQRIAQALVGAPSKQPVR